MDKQGVQEFKGYLEYVFAETRKRYKAGMLAFESAKLIAMDQYALWTDGKHIVATVATIYRELSGDGSHADVTASFAEMAELAER